MRKTIFLLAVCVGLAGCAESVTFKNPVDGKIGTCTGTFFTDLNVWSNYHLCRQQFVSAGFQRVR